MKKRIYSVLIICVLLVITAVIGYNVEAEKSNLPIYESNCMYPAFTLDSLTDMATYILEAEVVEVGDSFMKEIPVSLTENPAEASEVIGYPVTPITLKVKTDVKGNIVNEEFTYYEEGGITSTYIQLPDGYAMEEGMEILLFLNQDGYCWGAESMFPIVEDKIILNKTAQGYFDENDTVISKVQDLDSAYRSQISTQNVSLVEVNDFIDVIQSIIKEDTKT